MPLVFLPDPLAFFSWTQGEVESTGLEDPRRPMSLAELILPPDKRTVIIGTAIPLADAIPRLASLNEDEVAALTPSAAVWAAAVRFATGLVEREQIAPRMSEVPDGYEARWAVALAHEQERRYVRSLAAAMPPAAHAVPVDTEGGLVWPAEQLLRRLLDEVADTLVRAGAARKKRAPRKATEPPQAPSRPTKSQDKPPRDAWGTRWSNKLSDPDRRLPAGLIERRAAKAISDWSGPVLGDGERLRAAFRLELPEAEDSPFLLRFLLQDTDDPSLLMTADELWSSESRDVQRLGQLLRDPPATLLAALYRAAQVMPSLAPVLGQITPTHLELTTDQAWAFLGDGARALAAAGFSVLVPGELTRLGRLRLQMDFGAFDQTASELLPDNEPTLEEWLSFEWRVALGEETLSEGEFLALAAQKAPLIKFRGQWVVVDPAELPRIQEKLKSRSGKLRSRDALVAALAGETKIDGVRARTRALGALGRLLDQLRGAEREVAAPAGLQAELRPYQRRGLGWLSTMAQLGLGACLADDMGLGKTMQLLALILRRLESPNPPTTPALLVAPTSVLGNWEREIARFAPSIKTLRHYGPGRAGRAAQITEQGPALVLTTYGMLWRDAAMLGKIGWWMVALDEAQNIKNSRTTTSKAARSIEAPFRVALTGTPVENRLSELWSILDFVNPGLLGSEDSFRLNHALPVEQGSEEAATQLRRIVGPFVLRRMKSDPQIAPDLPAKEEMNVICTLTREQATLYKAAVDAMLAAIGDADGITRKGLVLALLTRLKQICNHPAQFLKEAGPLPRRSGKLQRLTEMLEETLAEGEKALIFTQYHAMGTLLQKHLCKSLKIDDVLYLHGQTPRQERDRLVESFQRTAEGGPRLFILSLKAGGTGLNLTAATQVFFFDRWWNPAVEEQATDRAHRIGQKHRVQVYKLVCAGTVEDKIDLMIRSKKDLASKIIGAGEQWITELGDEQLRELFSLAQGAVVGDDEPTTERKRPAQGKA